MEENKITIQQAYYGEVDRGHSCINQTVDNPDLNSHLIAFTDRPAALPPGVELVPYFSGMALLQHYIFTKTFADPFATRSGMVFTHVLIINQNDMNVINNLDDIFSYFIDIVPEERAELDVIYADVSKKKNTPNVKIQPRFIKETISSLLNGKSPILFSGKINSFKLVLQQLWNSPNMELKKRLKFRTSFTPSDIEDTNDLTIVSIQKEFLPKWSDRTIIQSENDELVEVTSHCEMLFLGHKEDNPFYSFLVDLNVKQNEFSNFALFDKVFNDFCSIDKLENADIVRTNIRILSIISPSAHDGGKIKNKFINRLDELVKLGLETNLKALRNIEWSAFANGETRVKQLLAEFIAKELENPFAKIKTIEEFLNISFSAEQKNWWHNTVQISFKSMFVECSKTAVKNLWKLITCSDKAINDIFTLLPSTKEMEVLLTDNIPTEIPKKTIKTLELISKERTWYLLHANILLKDMTVDKAITNQLSLEHALNLNNSVGVKYLTEKLNDKELIALTLLTCENKLVQIVVDRILENTSLLKNLNVNMPCWLDIWSCTLEQTKYISEGIEGHEHEFIDSVLDLITEDKHVPEIIIQSIANSNFNDLSNYRNRDKIWGKIPLKFTDQFLSKTTTEVVKKFLLDEIRIDSIEEPLIENITSDTFMTNYLSEHRANIHAVIKVYEAFSTLKDNFLADYVTCYKKSISKTQSINLGILVNEKNFSKTARRIYEKSKYNNSFKVAFEYCRDLVDLKWWEGLWSHNNNKTDFKQDKKSKRKMIKSLPTVVILTAIKEEYAAVKQHLKSTSDVDQNNTSYEAGIFEFNDKEIAKVIIRECGAKNTVASQESERAIQYFKPDCMFFVGIAGSRKPNDFTIGDVIFPEKIYSYVGGKSDKSSFKSRPDFANADYSLTELAKKERRKNDWKVLIKNHWEKDVQADLGVIASGDQIVEHYNSGIGEILTEHFNDTSAVEMEGFGFAKAANRQGRATSHIVIGIVRGISDIIEQPKENHSETKADRRPNNAKEFASDTAAAFVFWLIIKACEDNIIKNNKI